MGSVERGDDVCAVVVFGAREEVGEDVLLPRAMPSADGNVEFQR